MPSLKRPARTLLGVSGSCSIPLLNRPLRNLSGESGSCSIPVLNRPARFSSGVASCDVRVFTETSLVRSWVQSRGCAKPLLRLAGRALGGTTRTGSGAVAASADETEPRTAARTTPWPRDPTTISATSPLTALRLRLATGSPSSICLGRRALEQALSFCVRVASLELAQPSVAVREGRAILSHVSKDEPGVQRRGDPRCDLSRRARRLGTVDSTDDRMQHCWPYLLAANARRRGRPLYIGSRL